jgi:F-type H+-transporting ATPase subunit a
MSDQHSPLEQFVVKPLAKIQLAGYDLSFTNSSLFMILSLMAITALLTLPMRGASLVPNRMQSVVEVIYQFIASTIKETAGDEGKKYMPFVFTIFMFVLMCNLLGMLPYSFTVTSHIIVTFVLALLVFLIINIIAFARHGFHFFSLFLPEGTPWWIAPLMIVIEVFTYLARPITLSIRLAANMVAGHVLIKVIAGFAVAMGLLWAWLPVSFVIVLTGLEIFVAILQAYVFTILTCVYLNDAINLH